MKKKLICLILAALMVLSIMPSNIFAATDNSSSGAVIYLNKTLSDGVIETTEELSPVKPVSVTAADTVWGAEGETSWYIADSSISLAKRPEIKGDVNLILKNGITLTASSGITLVNNNSLTVFSQSDDEAVMGQLVAAAAEGNAVFGGLHGKNSVIDVSSARSGQAAGALHWKGGALILTNEAGVGIGGGNGGKGGSSLDTQGFSVGAYGGNGNDVTVYGGIIEINCKCSK